MKKYLALGLMALMFSVGITVKPDFAQSNVEGGRARVVIPAHAIEVAPGIFSLGTAVDNWRIVEGYAIITYKKGFGKPTGCKDDGVCQGWESASCDDCSGSGEEPDASSCYGFLSKRAKWKSIESYIVNPENIRGLDESFVASNFAMDIGKWESAAGTEILGDEVTGVVDGADMDSPDNKNEVYFGDISEPGAIAVTIVWGVFGGPPPFRELVEWDQVYDDVDFDWSMAGESGKMDFENIATHELGHSVGLDDLYSDECSEQTMYGYAGYGETSKRTLESGDINGIQKLYS